MLRTPYVLILALSAVHIPSILAAPPGCTRWDWPGYVMGNNPWAAVLSPSKFSADSVVSTACTTSIISAALPASSTSLSIVLGGGSLTSKTSSSFTSTSTSTSKPLSSSSSEQTQTVSASSEPSSSNVAVSSSASSTDSLAATSDTTTDTSTSEPPPTSEATTTTIPSTTFQPTTTSEPSTTSNPPLTTSTKTAEIAPAPSSSSPTINSASTVSGSNGSGASDSDVSTYLSTHNTIRAQHGASDLVWNNTLATAAQKWSDGCVFQHSGGKLGPFGENLAAGTGSSYDITSAVTSWTNEASQYDPNNPVASHFTQVVWKASTQVGCALTSCPGGSVFAASFGNSNFYVCEYFPQGNVIGQFGTDVQA